MSEFGAVEKTSVDPEWVQAHRKLNDMRDYLIQCRNEAQMRGDSAGREVAEYNAAIERIQPPPPIQATPASMIGGSSPSFSNVNVTSPRLPRPF